MDLEEAIMHRIKCKKCQTFLSIPFKLTAETIEQKNEIKIHRYKGDNINYHAENDYNKIGKILYSFIYCLKCHEKVGYWMSQASKREEKNINQIFFWRKCVDLERYHKKSVSEEEDKKFEQEEAFYNSQFLTKEVIDYAKEHIDNFIKNVEMFEKQRTEARHCYDSFDRNIVSLKELFVKLIQRDKKQPINLGIDFSKQEISDAEKRNKLRLRNFERYKDFQEDDDSKSNGRKINNNDINEIEENGQNIINNDEANNGNDNENGNGLDKNGGDNIEMSDLSNNMKSDVYLEDKLKQKNNKQPSQNAKKNNKKNKKRSKTNQKKK